MQQANNKRLERKSLGVFVVMDTLGMVDLVTGMAVHMHVALLSFMLMDMIVQPLLAKPMHHLNPEEYQHDAHRKLQRRRAPLADDKAKDDHADRHYQQCHRVAQPPDRAPQQ